jgi:REP element-mobilizing transposase RayT
VKRGPCGRAASPSHRPKDGKLPKFQNVRNGTQGAQGPGVTTPRQVLPGTTYLVTRRCSERRRFLRPGALVNEIFLFVLALGARRYGIEVHAFCVMSNHYHLLVTDPHAKLPAFVQYLDALVARAVNASLGRWEGFWASGTSFSAVSNTSSFDVVRKAAYVLANPVVAGLVQHGREWPGLRTGAEQLGAVTLTARRPAGFFRAKGTTPESLELELTVPPGFTSAQEFRDAVSQEVRALEDETRRAFSADGRRFLGRAKVLAQDPLVRPAGAEPRRKMSPRIAALDAVERIDAIARLKRFVREYREALAKLRAGIRDIGFPAGTYRLRVEFGVRCAAVG